MSNDELFRRVVGDIGDFLKTDVSHLRLESRLTDAVAGVDSMKLFDILLTLEDRYDVRFPDTVMGKLNYMRDLVDEIQALMPASGSAGNPARGGNP